MNLFTIFAMSFELNPNILEAEVEQQQMLVLDPDKGEYFELNATSVFILKQIKKGLEFEQIIDKMLAHYDCDKITAERDLNKLIQSFKTSGILL